MSMASACRSLPHILSLPLTISFAFDMRGHGHTKAGVSPVFMDSVRDLDTFAKFLQQSYAVREEDIFVVANSIGGVITSAWVHDFAPRIAGMALLAPAFEINLIVSFGKTSHRTNAKDQS